jgi:outer membrane receptor protein involved in Fe transport
VNVIQMSARDINLTSRQGTSTLSNSQLALLDGRSIYLDFFGLILWDFVPSNAADIKQIEVVRGPASAVWGANALTGVVNIITKSPREMAAAGGTNVILTGGTFDRNTEARDMDSGTSYGASISLARAPNDRFSYKLSAGYYNSDAYPRPAARVPQITDPRGGSDLVGGAFIPAFPNTGTSQPKVDVRVDQDLTNQGRISYSAGYGGTEGIIHSGIGPFDIQSGSWMSYGFKAAAFVNLVDVTAPNLLTGDVISGQPLRLDFKTRTYDLELGNSHVVAERHILSYGGNARRNDFDITITPQGEDRNEFGAYFQDEIFWDKFRFTLGGRIDKFGNIEDPVFSPRLTALFKPAPAHSFRLSYNQAFRSPSTINNFIDVTIDLARDPATGLPLRFPLGAVCQLAPPLCAANPGLATQSIPLGTRLIGNQGLKEEKLTAYEAAYTGTFGGRTTFGLAFYINDQDDNINFVTSPALIAASGLDAFYSSRNPPPGWPFPASLLDLPPLRAAVFDRVPATFTYLNLGPIRNKGVEVSLDHTFTDAVTAFANYSWQARPEPLEADDDQIEYAQEEIGLPAKNRFNVGLAYNDDRFLGNVTVNYADKSFWSDVLTANFHGFTDAYTLVNATAGVKWANGKVATSVKVVNLLNEEIQQHIFGDVLKRSIVGELRLKF